LRPIKGNATHFLLSGAKKRRKQPERYVQYRPKIYFKIIGIKNKTKDIMNGVNTLKAWYAPTAQKLFCPKFIVVGGVHAA
jgi:hypothetical protein